MPEYLSPGVYVEEIEIGGKPIEGVSTSTAGFLGETERGPTDLRLITNFGQYERFVRALFLEDRERRSQILLSALFSRRVFYKWRQTVLRRTHY